jgi:hypothetical protein
MMTGLSESNLYPQDSNIINRIIDDVWTDLGEKYERRTATTRPVVHALVIVYGKRGDAYRKLDALEVPAENDDTVLAMDRELVAAIKER